MCQQCYLAASLAATSGASPDAAAPGPAAAQRASPWHARRAFLLAAAGTAVAASARAQVDVGESSRLRNLVPAQQLENSAQQQYGQMLQQAQAQRALAPDNHPQLQRIRGIARRLIPHATPWNDRARHWRWEVNLFANKAVNAFCMPGGKIALFTGLLTAVQPSDDELAMVMGHEMAHALREHARERIAKSQGTGMLLSLGAQLLGLGQLGDVAANVGTQLLTLKFSRDDEIEADLVGLELAARGGYNPEASVTLWQKMSQAGGGNGGGWLSSHPAGPERMKRLQDNIPRVRALYQAAAPR